MKTLIYMLPLLLALPAMASTPEDLRLEIDNVPGVEEAILQEERTDMPIFTGWEIAKISYLYQSGGVIQDNTIAIIIKKSTGDAYYVSRRPSILPIEPVDAYITGRTGTQQNPLTPFTRAEVQSFCNIQWRATTGNSAALAVKEFQVSNVDPNTVRVSGLFHDVATNTRPRLTYLITLIDANGATTGANVKFEKVIE